MSVTIIVFFMYSDSQLDLSDGALSLMGLSEEEFKELKRTRKQQTNTATGATGAR